MTGLLALCQDCLAVIPLEWHSDQYRKECICGGDICACNECQRTVELLMDGCTDPAKLSVKSDPGELDNWDRITGVRP